MIDASRGSLVLRAVRVDLNLCCKGGGRVTGIDSHPMTSSNDLIPETLARCVLDAVTHGWVGISGDAKALIRKTLDALCAGAFAVDRVLLVIDSEGKHASLVVESRHIQPIDGVLVRKPSDGCSVAAVRIIIRLGETVIVENTLVGTCSIELKNSIKVGLIVAGSGDHLASSSDDLDPDTTSVLVVARAPGESRAASVVLKTERKSSTLDDDSLRAVGSRMG